MDAMRISGDENNIPNLLGFRINLYGISGQGIPRENPITNQETISIYRDDNDLIPRNGVIEICAEQEKQQDHTDKILVENRK